MTGNAASKRVTAVTGYMLGLLVVAGPVGLYRLDAESFRQDAQTLLALQRLDGYLAANDPAREAVPFRQAATGILARDHAELYAAMIAGRRLLTDHLMRGLDGHQPFGCEDFGSVAVEGKPLAAQRNEVEVPFALLSLESPWLVRSRDAGTAERGSVAELLDRLAEAQAPVTFRVGHDLALAPVAATECPPPPPFPQQRYWDYGVYTFSGATLGENSVVVEFQAPVPQQQQQQLPQGGMLTETVEVQAKVTELTGPPSTVLMAGSAQRETHVLGLDLGRIGTKTSSLAQLRKDYGYLPIDYAVSTAGAALVQGYAGTTVLGLKVTSRRLALVIGACAIGLAGILLAEAGLAAAARRPLRDDEPDGPRAVLASTPVGRAVTWSVAPAAAILLAAPWTPVWIAGAALAAGLGAVATLLAARADRSATSGPVA